MTSIRSSNDGNESAICKDEESNSRLDHTKSDGKKNSSSKGKKQAQDRSITDKVEKVKDHSLGRRASEGATEKKKVTYKLAAQDKGSRMTDKENSDVMRSMSVSTTAATKDTSAKKLPAIPMAMKTGDRSGSRNEHDKVKESDGEKTHKYANVELNAEASKNNSVEILEPKYDEVDTESTKKSRKQDDKETVKIKHKRNDNDHEHFYHTLEESEKVGGGGVYDEEYDSPKSKALVITRTSATDKKGKTEAMNTDENATVKEARGTRAKSYSGKKSSKEKNKKDPEYDQPTHNTLPHKTSASTEDNKKGSPMQAGNLASMFDDPMYVASKDVKTTPQLVSVKDTSPERKSAEAPAVLRNPEQAKKATDDPEYDQPNENKGKLKKEALYSSRLFDDPKYEGGLP